MHKILVYRQLAVMLGTGVPIVKALEACAACCGKTGKEAWDKAAAAVSAGHTLALAMSEKSEYFSFAEIGLIRAGEISCELAESCSCISEFFSFEENLRRRIFGALQYPLILCLAMAVLASVIILQVIPAFKPLLAESAAELPLFSLLLFYTAELMEKPAVPAGMLLLLLLGGLTAWHHFRSPYGRRRMQSWVLTLPVVGNLCRNVVLARFCKTMSMMLRSGVPLQTSMQISALALGNYPLAEAVDDAAEEISEGTGIAEAFAQSGYFSESFVGFINTAAEASSMDDMLSRLAELYHSQSSAAIENLSVMAEPVLIFIMGSFTAVVLLALFLPLYNFISNLS